MTHGQIIYDYGSFMTKKQTSTRARNSAAKAARKELILSESLKLFESQDFDSISMESIARKAGLAKGTLYLYFKTKEEVFLGCTESSFTRWVHLLENSIPSQSKAFSASEIADLFVVTIKASSELPRLLSHLHIILEKNISEESARSFKLELKAKLLTLASLMTGKTSALAEPEYAISFLLKSYSLMLGLYQVCNPAPQMQKVLSDPELSLFVLNFEEQLYQGLKLLLLGFEKEQNKSTYHLYGNY
jgi:TetR/AcrR family transcriptional regulator